jgi:hypothetical protein
LTIGAQVPRAGGPDVFVFVEIGLPDSTSELNRSSNLPFDGPAVRVAGEVYQQCLGAEAIWRACAATTRGARAGVLGDTHRCGHESRYWCPP